MAQLASTGLSRTQLAASPGINWPKLDSTDLNLLQMATTSLNWPQTASTGPTGLIWPKLASADIS